MLYQNSISRLIGNDNGNNRNNRNNRNNGNSGNNRNGITSVRARVSEPSLSLSWNLPRS